MSFKSRRTVDFGWRLRAEPFSHERSWWLRNLAPEQLQMLVRRPMRIRLILSANASPMIDCAVAL
jgi:hypothetical protein